MIMKTQPTAGTDLRTDAGILMPLGLACIVAAGRPVLLDRSSDAGSSSVRQILVIDDDPHVRELVAKTVTRAGFRADTESDGESGWHALCRVAYDLVITDNEMPRLTGLKLIERIRGFSNEPPCILISGKQLGDESTRMPLVGIDGFLAKPFSPAALIEKVYDLLLHGQSMEP
jgi:DNA-binding response OmpR family regulator